MAKRRYRSNGGWVMGSYWEAGRIGELHEEQAAGYLAVLTLLDDKGRPVAPEAHDAAPTSLVDQPPPKPVLPPPPVRKKRPGMTSTVGVPTGVASSVIDNMSEKK